ncbi:MAG: GNAT family N-acetyltransferase, partial [Chloroflexota bacterium]
ANLDHPTPHPRVPWDELRARNVPLLRRLTDVYGACALLAWHDDRVVGQVRFYPKAVAALPEAGGMCLQQTFPAGPSDHLAEMPLPPLAALPDRTLAVHCLMTGSPQQAENPHQRRGLGTALARALIAWAREQGWGAVEATAYQDLPLIYAITGQAGRRFWEKVGLCMVAQDVEPALGEDSGFARELLRQAAAAGLTPEDARARFTMRIELA